MRIFCKSLIVHLHGAVGHVTDALLRPNNKLHWNGPARLETRKYVNKYSRF